MSGVALETELSFFSIFKWQTRNDGDAVVALLAVDGDMFISKFANFGIGELAIATLGFLKAKNVRLMFNQESSDEVPAMTDGIDIPACNLQFQRIASRCGFESLVMNMARLDGKDKEFVASAAQMA